MFGDVVEQWLALHVLKHQKWRAEQASGVDQARDARMVEPCQHCAFLRKTRFETFGVAFSTQEFDRDLGLIKPVGPCGEPDFAHAADADDFLEFPGAAQLARVARGVGTRALCPQCALQQPVKAALAAIAEHWRELRGQAIARTADDIRNQRLGMGAAQQLAHFIGQTRVAGMQLLDEIGT